DDSQDVESGDLAGVLRRLALRIVEVRGDGDNSLADLISEVVLRGLLHLLQDHRGDLGRRIALALDLDRSELVRPRYYLIRNALFPILDLADGTPHEALIEKTVFCGFVTAWRLATCPTSRSPSFVKPTTEGV